jgi:hypothetical protein
MKEKRDLEGHFSTMQSYRVTENFLHSFNANSFAKMHNVTWVKREFIEPL